MKKSCFLFAFILSACGPMRLTPKQNYTRTETATFWGLFTACQGAEAMDAAQTYHGIANHQGIEGDPIAKDVGLNPRSANQIVLGSIVAQVGIDAVALGLHYFGRKKWMEKFADSGLAACGVLHGLGAASW